nr:immunoglobulin heavy chain junction region [Macaca mulatta]MOX93584.1 immunoglobulin heavy chain junction region [Macaca mulatta]MOX93962.1 immunoglobulin heavy chain junction region [Macaca mulatta]MOX94378.1 immunoglobulin heavy chain junction region [Macaca mulatta]MOX94414.1 immunoglobulin heavy chain junction region [Macaca mulatta]
CARDGNANYFLTYFDYW